MSMENAPRNTIVFRMRALSICLFSLLLIPNALALTGCERDKNKSTSEQESPTKGAIAIREVQVTSSPTAATMTFSRIGVRLPSADQASTSFIVSCAATASVAA